MILTMLTITIRERSHQMFTPVIILIRYFRCPVAVAQYRKEVVQVRKCFRFSRDVRSTATRGVPSLLKMIYSKDSSVFVHVVTPFSLGLFQKTDFGHAFLVGTPPMINFATSFIFFPLLGSHFERLSA